MGSEVSDRTVLQDETFCVLRSANIRCVTGLALSTFCTTSRSTSEVSSSSTSKPSAWNPSVHHTLPLSSRQLLAAHDVDRGRFPALTLGMTSPVSGSSATFSTTDSCSRKSLKTEIPLWSRE